MESYRISPAKTENLKRCTHHGIIAAAAMDQRGSLARALANQGGSEPEPEQLRNFKQVVTEVLTPHASAVLLDPVFGLPASEKRAPGTGLLLAYEISGYDNKVPGRLPSVLEGYSVRRLAEASANGVKVLLYYNPFDEVQLNERKHAFIERVGAECQAVGLPFFLEPVTYDEGIDDDFEWATRKPEYVKRTMEEFSRERYGVDILKVEFPFDARYTETLGDIEHPAYNRDQAIRHAQEAAEVAGKPFIFLSAGVDMSTFIASLELVGEAGVPFSGVLCGRATWKGGIPVYARHGKAALRSWLEDEGVRNIKRLNEVLETYARPWWEFFGGLEEFPSSFREDIPTAEN